MADLYLVLKKINLGQGSGCNDYLWGSSDQQPLFGFHEIWKSF
jgi:hypothetical protein